MTSKQVRNDDTPIRNTSQSYPEQEQPDDQHTDAEADFLNTARGLAEMAIPSEISSTLTLTLLQLQQVFSSMKKEMTEFTASLNNTTADITEFRKEISDMKSKLKQLDSYKTEVQDLRAEVSYLRKELATMEQRKYLKDVEITGLTETRGENLQQVVNIVSTKLGVQLDSRDVDDVRRVGKKAEGAASVLERPRPVVLTFSRRAPRDQLLRAARVRRVLNTTDLGIQGNNRPVYINEHLTKENRVLFSKTRSVKKQLNYKYAWTSNGSIFLRRSETSSVIHITSDSMLDKLLKNVQTSEGPPATGESRDTAGLPPTDPTVNASSF
ncbi:uncharacterized protein LOC133521728 [Cydia pomonella]|uniref:uncharacterized protein LOC133521728 n=1 Tax=Cydia pomonella TaxID=82600 RepID=UPI002ADD5921|nr:uncharacterized protein LOC133521728 [Cydia pomonella]